MRRASPASAKQSTSWPRPPERCVIEPTDDIRALSARLAADPSSLVFLQLGEALRRRGQLESARKVLVAGLRRYPDLADAHDLLARVYGDQRDFERAFDEWDIALRLEPGHIGAHKGIGFLYVVAGDPARAREHLAHAAAALPDDQGVRAALDRLSAAPAADAPLTPDHDAPSSRRAVDPSSPPADVPSSRRAVDPSSFDPDSPELVLVNPQGLRLGGGLRTPDGADVADSVAAELTGVSREAARMTRLLGLGEWRGLAAECARGNLVVVPATSDAVLLLARDRHVPVGRLGVVAARAAESARRWLEALA
jgi:tetratricopeptide (TPR) repeat protein